MQVLARGFQLAWPPLAYSIRDDDEARRVYSAIFTWFAAVLAFAVTGLWLDSRWIVRLLAAPDFFDSYEAVGLLATGIALYALYLAMVVILGRTGRTEFSFPATIAAVSTNVALNLALVPSHGIVGAGLALVASYLVVLALMYAFTQRLFPVPYEWRRLALAVLSAAALVGAGEALLPTAGLRRPREPNGALARLPAGAVRARVPARRGALPARRRCCARRRSPTAPWACAPRPPSEGRGEPAPHIGPEVYEALARDEDRSGT